MNLVKECRHSQRNESSTNKDRKSHTAMKTAHTGVHLLLSLKCLGQRTESYSPMAGKSNAANLSHSRSNAPHPGCLHLQVRGKIQSHQFIAINQFFDSTSFTILLTASVIPQSPTKTKNISHSQWCMLKSLTVRNMTKCKHLVSNPVRRCKSAASPNTTTNNYRQADKLTVNLVYQVNPIPQVKKIHF